MANFTCVIKNKNAGIIKWRIGHFSQICNGYSIDGMDVVCTTTVDGKELTETIGVKATVDLHGTPVQCMLDSFVCKKKNGECNEYSDFALLKVNPAATAVNETEDTQGMLKLAVSFILLASFLYYFNFHPTILMQNSSLQAHLRLPGIAGQCSACPLTLAVRRRRRSQPHLVSAQPLVQGKVLQWLPYLCLCCHC